MQVGDYQVTKELARGGQGIVYQARRADGRQVAIKLLLTGQGAGEVQRKRFQREAEALKRLRHPNVVGILGLGTHQGAPYLVMDWVPGTTLEERLRQGPLAPRAAVALVRKLALALQHAHDKNVLHRDVKPANVIIDEAGEPWLTDFGLTRDVDPSLSRTQLSSEGRFMGTPGFLAPEQARGELGALGPRTDVFGLGALLYACLTGRPPFAGEALLELLVRMESPPESPRRITPGVDRSLEALCLRCLAYEPAERVANAGDLAWELGKLLEQPPRAGGRARAWLAGALIAAVAVAGLAAWLARPDPLEQIYSLVMTYDEVDARRALALLDAAAGDGEPSARLLALRALARQRADGYAAAEADVAAALERDPECALAHFAHAWSVIGDDAAAQAAVERAIELDPDDPQFHHLHGNLIYGRQDLDFEQRTRQALAAFDRALALDPQLEKTIERRASVLVWSEDYAAAAEGFSDLIELRPDDHEPWAQRAGVRRRAGDDEGALADYDRALALDPDYDLGYLARADIRERLGDRAGALADYERFLELDPDSPLVRESVERLRGELGASR
jgi:tetratricopeptide (TPR) repeat protein/predicted Ser/Thr protein kinase